MSGKDPPRGSAEPEPRGVVNAETAARFEFGYLPGLLRNRSWLVLLISESLDWVAFSILFGWAFTWLDSLILGQTGMLVIGMRS